MQTVNGTLQSQRKRRERCTPGALEPQAHYNACVRLKRNTERVALLLPCDPFSEFVAMNCLDIRHAVMRIRGCVCRLWMLGRRFGVTRMTLCRWNARRHRHPDDSRRKRTKALRRTGVVFQRLRASLQCSPFRIRSMFESRIVPVFDRSASRQCLDAAIRATGSGTKTSGSRCWTASS